MKTSILLLASALLLSSSAKAQFDYYDMQRGLYSVTPDSAGDIKKSMGYAGDVPADGPVTMTKTAQRTRSDSGYTTTMTRVVTVNLVMKKGKIASIDAFESVKQHDVQENSLGSLFAALTGGKAPAPIVHDRDLGVYNILQKSFDASVPAPAPHGVAKKTPSSVPSVTNPNPAATQNVQQNVAASQPVSPSAP